MAGEREKSPLFLEIWDKLKNPLNILLFGLAGLSWLLSDLRSAAVIATMVLLSIGLGFIQEHRSSNAAAKLANMVRVQVMVKRQGVADTDTDGIAAIPLDGLVPGDIVKLSAGDMVPADVRLCSANDLYVNQSTLTGESMPVEKNDAIAEAADENPLALPNICFMGSSISSGYGTAVVVHTGDSISFGTLARQIMAADAETSFDRGIRSFSWLMFRFILVMVPLVFLINGLTKHNCRMRCSLPWPSPSGWPRKCYR